MIGSTQPHIRVVTYMSDQLLGGPGTFEYRKWTLSLEKGQIDHLEQDLTTLSQPTLYLISSAEFLKSLELFKRFTVKQRWANPFGVVVIDEGHDAVTIKMQKKMFELEQAWTHYLRFPYTQNDVRVMLSRSIHSLLNDKERIFFESIVDMREDEAHAINAIGQTMTRYTSVDQLLKTVLEESAHIAGADCGFIILRENLISGPEISVRSRKPGQKFIKKATYNRSCDVKPTSVLLDPQLSKFTSFITNNACGIEWHEGLSSPTVLHSDEFPISPSTINPPEIDFDPKNYCIKSYCAFPLRSPSEEVFGYILLINSLQNPDKKITDLASFNNVTAFSSRKIQIMESISNQLAVSLDHIRIYRDLKNLFEGFVKASITAIESRDPTTRGHSDRVALMTVSLAEAVSATQSGSYSSTYFTPKQLYEIKFASLLHDFGKIGVREDVLQKSNKLFSHELMQIKERFSAIQNKLHVKCLETYLEALMRDGKIPTQQEIAEIQVKIADTGNQLNQFWLSIASANEPNVVHSDLEQNIAQIAATKIMIGTEPYELLSQEEMVKLTIRKGSLSDEERREIESHVTHSYRFLRQIPWSRDLEHVPEIVFAHHERNNGGGYPRKLLAEEIPLQAKIMAIPDIYDALVAMDRPYKKAVPAQRALSILEAEVREGKLDAELFRIFTEAKIWALIEHSEEESAA